MTAVRVEEAANRTWDAIVIGAGPAGSIAARELSRQGLSVLLVDKARFPRGKVCGCCLNAPALETLGSVGLGSLPRTLGGVRLEKLKLFSHRGRQAEVALSGGVAISRERLDQALMNAAVAAGAMFIHCAATVGASDDHVRQVRLGSSYFARTRMLIVADGLGGTSLAELPQFTPRILRRSRIGIGAVLDSPPWALEPGAITMVCGRRGYLGAVHVEEGKVDVAAAVDPALMKAMGGPRLALLRVLGDAGIEAELSGARWRGTNALTRRRRVEGDRLLIIGDAAGYVEPFTGEGMVWGIAGAIAAAGIAAGAVRAQVAPDGRWTATHRRLVFRRHLECRALATLLRHPRLTAGAIGMIAAVPALASPLARRINRTRESAA